MKINCTHSNCSFIKFENEDKCIFHCDKNEKNGWIIGSQKEDKNSSIELVKKWNIMKVDLFWEKLNQFINLISKYQLKSYTEFPIISRFYKLSDFLQIMIDTDKQTILINGIKIPPKINTYLRPKYSHTFTCSFNNCYFYDNLNIDFPENNKEKKVNFNFYSSTFENNLVFLRDSTNKEKLAITDCTFNGDIRLYNPITDIIIGKLKVKMIEIEPWIYESKHQVNLLLQSINMDSLLIKNVKVNKFTLSDVKTKKLVLNNLYFNEGSRINFYDIKVNDFEIASLLQDSKRLRFKNIIVENNLTFNKIDFNNSYFSDLKILNAKVTIEETSFTNASLNSIEWNISNIDASKDTFRQLKDIYEKQGNYLEANNFFVMEMKKHREKLKKKNLIGNIQEKFVFFLNEKMSNFGQSYLKPSLWLIFFIVIFTLIKYSHTKNYLYEIYPSYNVYFIYISNICNNFASSLLIFKKFLYEGLECLSLLFNIIFSILIWQIIVAVKRHTKR